MMTIFPPLSAAFIVKLQFSDKYLSLSRLSDVKLEVRKNKSIPSIVIKNLILMILKSNAFRFGNEYHRQVTGTAMETSMVPIYVLLLMDNFEQNLLHDTSQKTGLSPLVGFWFWTLKLVTMLKKCTISTNSLRTSTISLNIMFT